MSTTTVRVLGDAGASYDVFDLVSFDDKRVVVRGSLLFEVGEQLHLRIDRAGEVTEVRGRVEQHVAPNGEPGMQTEIAVLEVVPVRKLITG
jgi:hypothetical protein